jgi:hypothetical protein
MLSVIYAVSYMLIGVNKSIMHSAIMLSVVVLSIMALTLNYGFYLLLFL